MSDTPQWKSDFPVRRSGEYAVSRRQFCKLTCGTALAVGAGGLARDTLFPAPPAAKPKLLGRLEDLPVGGYKLFRYPTRYHPCIVVRLGETEIAAFSQACTHLQCPVHYLHAARQFYCPCHEGYFSAEDGRVLAGPPRRPLPRFSLTLRHGEIWITPESRNV